MRPIIAAFLFLAAVATTPARAADEPEAVYAKYHRAAVTRDLPEMLRYASSSQRDELSGITAAQKDAVMKMMEATMPRAFVLRNKTLTPDGKGARLLVSGPGGPAPDGKPETLYGTISMLNERGEWKVAAINWKSNPPPGFAAAPAAAKSVAPAATTAAPARSGAGLVGSTSTPPDRKLGQAKEPCVYKAVMTAEDVENCR